jgi:hypothetical protein
MVKEREMGYEEDSVKFLINLINIIKRYLLRDLYISNIIINRYYMVQTRVIQ